MIKLNSNDHWYEVADCDIGERTISRVYRPEVEAYKVPTSGIFGTIGNERLLLWGLPPDKMMVAFEGAPQIPLHEAQVDWERSDDGKTRFVLSHGSYRHEVRYEVPDIEGEMWDTYSIELEDFDFGLFVLNIKNAPDRQGRLLSQWTGH